MHVKLSCSGHSLLGCSTVYAVSGREGRVEFSVRWVAFRLLSQ